MTELSAPAQLARETLIQVARLQLCTNEHKLYDVLAARFNWPARTEHNRDVWRDDLLYTVLAEVSNDQLQRGEPLLWSLVLADGSGKDVYNPN